MIGEVHTTDISENTAPKAVSSEERLLDTQLVVMTFKIVLRMWETDLKLPGSTPENNFVTVANTRPIRV